VFLVTVFAKLQIPVQLFDGAVACVMWYRLEFCLTTPY